jgi:hypothetical protein
VLLLLTLGLSILTFNRPRTNLLTWSVHPLVFALCMLLVLVFDRQHDGTGGGH